MMVFAVAMAAAAGTTAGAWLFATDGAVRAANAFLALLLRTDNEKYDGTQDQYDTGNE